MAGVCGPRVEISGRASGTARVFKEFRLFLRARLRVELTGTNVFNYPNWSNPDLRIGIRLEW